jgi:HK97 family phage prohead protease
MNETRSFAAADAGLEVRAAAEGEAPMIRGYGALFNSLSADLGGFREQIAHGAFDLKDDILGRYNHELLLGTKAGRTLELELDDKGLRYAIAPADTAPAQHVVKMIERGDVRGSSFMFRAIQDRWDRHADGTLLRTLIQVRTFDVGPVDMPAYPGTAKSGAKASVRELALPAELATELRSAEAAMAAARAGVDLTPEEVGTINQTIRSLQAILPGTPRLEAARAKAQAMGLI